VTETKEEPKVVLWLVAEEKNPEIVHLHHGNHHAHNLGAM